MGLFQPASRQTIAPHAHAAGDRCPLCEQPIAQDLLRRIEAKRREQEQAAEAKAVAAAEQRIAAARSEAIKTAEAAMLAKLSEIQARLAQSEQAKAAAQEQMAALKAAQEAAVAQRVAEIQEALQKERESAVLAEKAKVLKLQSDLADMQRKLESKTANELGEGSEVDLFEQLKATFEGDRIARVGKGVNGADVIHEVIHNGRVCGKIVCGRSNAATLRGRRSRHGRGRHWRPDLGPWRGQRAGEGHGRTGHAVLRDKHHHDAHQQRRQQGPQRS